MTAHRYVLIGLARVRAEWFADVASWANAGRVPVDFSKCVSSAEALNRIDDVRGASALVVESGVPGVHRDFIDHARERGVPTIVVDTVRDGTDWCELGAVAVLPHRFDHLTLIDVLNTSAQPVATASTHGDASAEPDDAHEVALGPLVAVVGANGSGTSTMAMAIAQGLASDQTTRVTLADFVRRGDLAMYHDARDVVPGFQELVEAHRSTTPGAQSIADMLFSIERRGYALLLGLRRVRDWTALRPRSVEAAITSLRSIADVVVADLDHEVDGEHETGSTDIEERNAATRTTLRNATVVVITADASLRGLHQLLHLQRDLSEFGVDLANVVTVMNRAPRSPRQRAEITASLAALSPAAARLSPVFVPERRNLDLVHSTGDPLPAQIVKPVTAAIVALIERGAGGAMNDYPPTPSSIDTASAPSTVSVKVA